MARNHAICSQIISLDADIISLQEYWFGCDKALEYIRLTFQAAGYFAIELQRTAHWRDRKDGLAVFYKKSRIVVQDYRNVLYHDAGDRVAQMLLFGLNPPNDISTSTIPSETPSQQFILANTHLLFPHNEYSTKIRLREITKLLGFIESYRQRELCTSICGRSDVKIPVIVLGPIFDSLFQVLMPYLNTNTNTLKDTQAYRLFTHTLLHHPLSLL